MKSLLKNNSVSINVASFTVMFKVFLNHFIRSMSVLQTPYPIAPKCRPKYLLESSGYSSCNLRDVRPFKRLTISLMFSDGLYLLTTPLSILTSSESQICFTSSRHLLDVPLQNFISIFCNLNYVGRKPKYGVATNWLFFTHKVKLTICVATESPALKAHSFN